MSRPERLSSGHLSICYQQKEAQSEDESTIVGADRNSIQQVLKQGTEGSEAPVSQLVRLAVQRIVEEALEGKVADLLGRGCYERRESVPYLFLDAIIERLRPGARRKPVLCAWAITWGGRKVLVHLAPGTKESTDCCKEFLKDLKRQRLKDVVLVVTDGAAGLIRAVEVEEMLRSSLRQRCLVHKTPNLASSSPTPSRPSSSTPLRPPLYKAPHQPWHRYSDRMSSTATATVTDGRALLRGGLRGLHRPSPVLALAPMGDPHHLSPVKKHDPPSGKET